MINKNVLVNKIHFIIKINNINHFLNKCIKLKKTT